MFIQTNGQFTTLLGRAPDARERLLRPDCGRSGEAPSDMTNPLRESPQSGRCVVHQESELDLPTVHRFSSSNGS
jgi:hypothetical protein